MKLNETPVRTSNNFNINNIKIENVELPKIINKFNNIEIIGTSEISKDVEKIYLTYGIGKILEENIINNANCKLKIKAQNNENISIIYDFDDENLNLINNIQIEVTGNVNIVIQYKSNTNKRCFHNGIIKLLATENSQVNVIIVNLLNEESDNFQAIENTLKTNAIVNYTIIDIGGKISISNYYSNIEGENSKNDLKTIYLGTNNQIKDINYIAELRGKKSFIDINVQGALKQNSKKNFKGTIDFKKGCKKAKGNENEFCMLLDNTAKSITLPMLLCTEDDVEGNHSAASGKVNKDELFYIMSKGIEENEAIKLLVKASFNKIIENIEDERLKEEILEEIDNRLD